MQSLVQTALEGQFSTSLRAGSGRGKEKLARPQPLPGAVNPGDSAPSRHRQRATTPAPHRAPAGAAGKEKKPLSLAVLGKPRNVHPGDSYPTTKTLQSSVEYCCIALVTAQQREKSWKRKKAMAEKIFLTKKDKDKCFSYLWQAFLCEI